MTVRVRPAERSDSALIARLFRISSDGVADYIWRQIGGPDADLLAIGTERYARQETAFSYQQCDMAEIDGTAVAMAHSFVIETPAGAQEIADTEPVLRPFMELEMRSLYLSGLATVESHRNRGIGRALLEACYAKARRLGQADISLICFAKNQGAMRLYRREGFEPVKSASVVPHPLIHHDGEVVLMARAV
jgi:GNAT superfamily N-acetyltransferase